MLPLVLLGLRTAVKEDLGFTVVAELTYGSPSCFPGEFLSFAPTSSHPDFVDKLKATMRHFKHVLTSICSWQESNLRIKPSDQLLPCIHL